MSRVGTILLVVALVCGLVAVPLGASTAVAEHNDGTTTVRPGERLAGVVGIQGAEVAGDLSDRSYEVRFNNAETDDERAAIVAERREELQDRLTDHQAELADLRAAREAGNISEGTYRARVATVAAEKATTERAAGRAGETARQLPESALEARGLSVESLQDLQRNASELGGPETAEIAREIGGPSAATRAASNGSPASRPAAADGGGAPPAQVDNRTAAAGDSQERNQSGDRAASQRGTAAATTAGTDRASPDSSGESPEQNAGAANRAAGQSEQRSTPGTNGQNGQNANNRGNADRNTTGSWEQLVDGTFSRTIRALS